VEAIYPPASDEPFTTTAEARLIRASDIESDDNGEFHECPAPTSKVDLSVTVYPRKCRLC